MARAIRSDVEQSETSLGGVFAGLVLGAIYVTLSFPGALVGLGDFLGWQPLHGLGVLTESEYTNLLGGTSTARYFTFMHLWTWILLLVATYLSALALIALRHVRPSLFAVGVASLALGLSSIHLLAWVAVIVFWVVTMILRLLLVISDFLFGVLGWLAHLVAPVFTWIFHALGVVLGWIFQVVGTVLGFIWGLVLDLIHVLLSSVVLAILGSLALIMVAALVITYREEILGAIGGLLKVLARVAAYVLAIWLIEKILPLLVAVLDFIGRILTPVFNFLAWLLAPVFRFLLVVTVVVLRIAYYVVIVLWVGYILYGFGALVKDQIRGAWRAGNGIRGALLGSLAIGTSLALVLMESNLYHVATYYPAFFAAAATTYLHQSSPIFDVLIALLVLAVSVLGVMRNLPKLLPEPDDREFRRAVVMLSFGLLFGIGSVGAAAHLDR